MATDPTVAAAVLNQVELLETRFAHRDVRDAVNALNAVLEADDTLDFLSYSDRESILTARDALDTTESNLVFELRNSGHV